MATQPRRTNTKAAKDEARRALIKEIRDDVEKAYSLSRDRVVNKILSRALDNIKNLD